MTTTSCNKVLSLTTVPLTVRKATTEDIPFIVRLAQAAHAKSPWVGVGFSILGLADALESLLQNNGVIYVHDHGVICGWHGPVYFNPKKMMLCKLFWIADKEGDALLDAFEKWAEENGAAVIVLGSINIMHGETVTKRLERRGYSKLEQQLIKVL